jgi:hypothetical protein
MRRLMGFINGYRTTQAIHVAVVLGIPELVASRPRSPADLADATATHPASLLRLLRTLRALGLLSEDADGKFVTTRLGEMLSPTNNKSLGAWAHLMGSGRMWLAWGGLLDAIYSGEPAFEQVHGASVWDVRRAHAEEGQQFTLAMREATLNVASEILAAVDFSRSSHVVDIGGGDGTLVSRILSEWPNLRATLFDLPYAIESRAQSALPSGLGERIEVTSGDFFQYVPRGSDTYLLKHVLHDWSDAQAEQILRVCRAAISDGARLLVVERILGSGSNCVEEYLADLHMMVMTGGRERSREEMNRLLQRAGFAVSNVTPLSGGRFIIEARSDGSA